MMQIILLWCLIGSISFSFGVDTIVVNQINNNYEITGQIPRFSAKDKEDEKLTSFLKGINDEINYDFSEMKGQVISEAIQFSDEFPDSNLLPFTINTSYLFTSNSDASIYSILIETSYYTGGAHQNYNFKSYTLDSNKRYYLEDFFEYPGKAKEYIVDSIEKQIHMNSLNSKNGSEATKYFDGVTIDLDDSIYYISGDNIIILFPHYILGPFSSGELEFTFTLKELEPFLHN